MINKELYVVKELLMLIDKYNHLIKTDGWYNQDVDKFYKLKDEVMEFLYVNKPKGIEIKLKRIPYLKRCEKCKDKAGDLMRSEGNAQGFAFYLRQIEPCSNDYEIIEKSTVEMEITIDEKEFCFHIPINKTRDWDINLQDLETKKWIQSKEFHHINFVADYNRMLDILDKLKRE